MSWPGSVAFRRRARRTLARVTGAVARVGGERGQAAGLAVLALPALLMVAAVVLDTGLAVGRKLALQGAVDAAALAAADAYDRTRWQACQVWIDEGSAASLAAGYLARNLPGARLVQVAVENAPDGSRSTVTVRGAYDVRLILPRVLGLGRVTVESTTRTTRTNAGCTF